MTTQAMSIKELVGHLLGQGYDFRFYDYDGATRWTWLDETGAELEGERYVAVKDLEHAAYERFGRENRFQFSSDLDFAWLDAFSSELARRRS